MLRSCSLVVLLGLTASVLGVTQGNSQGVPVQYGPPPQDLANALVQMARSSHVPLIAELTQPLPKIPTAEGVPLNTDTLDQLVKQAPDYEWKMEGQTVYFYNKKLQHARFNFLKLKFPRFTIPPNLSDLKLWLPGRATGLLEGLSAEGGATTGFGDAQLAKETLQRVTLLNVTPLEVLVHVANDSPTFYAVIIFPSATPTKTQAEKEVSWHWGSLNEKQKPLYAPPVKPESQKENSRSR